MVRNPLPNKHMSTTTDRALERVQNLYVMQLELLDLLERDLRDPDVRKQVRKTMKDFEVLLSKADWRYMGGEDVWEALKNLPMEMSKKLRESGSSTKNIKKRPVRSVKSKTTATKKVKAKRK